VGIVMTPDRVAQSTFDAVLFALREGGSGKLRDERILERLAQLSTPQLEQLVSALTRLQPRHPSIDDKLIASLREQLKC
jgi:hypothetical protein